MNKIKDKIWIIVSCILMIFSACQSTQIVDDKFINLKSHYEIALPGEPWERVEIHSEDLAMRNKENDAVFAIISQATSTEETTLDTLCKQLFIGIKKKNIIDKGYVNINNQRIMRIVLEGVLDNFNVKIMAYVVKSGEFVYDIVYWSAPDRFDTFLEDFEKAVRTLKLITDRTEQT